MATKKPIEAEEWEPQNVEVKLSIALESQLPLLGHEVSIPCAIFGMRRLVPLTIAVYRDR
jgi:hypothetical protein